MDYTDSEEGQYAMMQAQQEAQSEQEAKELLESYRELRTRVESLVDTIMPSGSEVRPVGCTSPAWRGIVRRLKEWQVRDGAADTVWVDWSNGNSHRVKVDEIEIVR